MAKMWAQNLGFRESLGSTAPKRGDFLSGPIWTIKQNFTPIGVAIAEIAVSAQKIQSRFTIRQIAYWRCVCRWKTFIVKSWECLAPTPQQRPNTLQHNAVSHHRFMSTYMSTDCEYDPSFDCFSFWWRHRQELDKLYHPSSAPSSQWVCQRPVHR